MNSLTLQRTPTTLANLKGEDYHTFISLSADERLEVRIGIQVFKEIEQMEVGICAACKIAAKQLKNQCPKLRGWSWKSIYNKYQLFTKGGRKTDVHGKPYGPVYEPRDWRCLIKNYSGGTDGLPKEFVSYLVAEWAKTTRENDAFKSLVERIKRDWIDGKEIPGYGTADSWYHAHCLPRPRGMIIRDADMPRGWTYKNLHTTLKKALPRKSQRRAAQGQTNRLATDWAVQLIRDRSQLLPFQLLTIDDVRLDIQCRMYVDGAWQPVYIDALFALDVATGYILAFGIKGQAIRRADTEQGRAAGTKMSIDGKNVRELMLSIFEQYGLPQWECRMLCEMATGRLNRDDEAGFLGMLGDRFKIDYTGMGRSQLLKSGFGEEYGRPGMKGWIESFFRKLHTTINHLPGTTGRRYELTRGDHAQRIKYTMATIKEAQKLINGPLTPEHPLNQQLRFPILEVSEMNAILHNAVKHLNWRTDHKLQGFERVWEYQTQDGRWIPEDALANVDPEERIGWKSHPRMEAPAERMQRLLTQAGKPFDKFDPMVLAALCSEKRLVTLKGGQITINDQRISMDSMLYQVDQNLDKYEGQKDALLAYIHPAYGHVVLADAKTGAHLSLARRVDRISLTDHDALEKRAGEVWRAREDELDTIRVHLTGQELDLAQMRDANAELMQSMIRNPLATEIATAERTEKQDRKKEKQLRKYARHVDASALLEDTDSTPSNSTPVFDTSELLADE